MLHHRINRTLIAGLPFLRQNIRLGAEHRVQRAIEASNGPADHGRKIDAKRRLSTESSLQITGRLATSTNSSSAEVPHQFINSAPNATATNNRTTAEILVECSEFLNEKAIQSFDFKVQTFSKLLNSSFTCCSAVCSSSEQRLALRPQTAQRH